MRASFLSLIGVLFSCTCIAVASDESLKGSLRGFLGDTIPDVPFEVTYADDIFNGDRELYKAWKWDQAEMAPIAITNFQVHNHYGKYDYIYAYNEKNPDEEWSFLKDMKYVDGWTSNYFKVKKMDEDEALTKLDSIFKNSGKKAVMFFIHGYNWDPYDNFRGIEKANDQSDYLVIPIMWNTARGLTSKLDYRYDRVVTAPRAATQLAKLESFFSRVKHKKAWNCHSMGCYVTQFFASEIDSNHPTTAANIFDIVFMVAPDVRYDIFNEYRFKSGKDKNECSPNSWNDPDLSERIPDCRAGGGNALVKLAKGGVDGTNKLKVYWNKKDSAGPLREFRLNADVLHKWPLSPSGLLNKGNESNRPPLLYFKDKVEFTKFDFDWVGAEHNYNWLPQMFDYYNKAL